MSRLAVLLAAGLALGATSSIRAEEAAAAPAFDAELAKKVGADERGMRQYIMVVLKTGPTPVTDPEKRKAMFAGHFANIERLAKEGKLAVAGPFGKNEDGWRGLYIFAVTTIEEAKALTETDPVIVNGEMVAEYHPWYGSAAAMLIPEWHEKLTPPAPSAASE
jgi:uncharacterized protein YciI